MALGKKQQEKEEPAAKVDPETVSHVALASLTAEGEVDPPHCEYIDQLGAKEAADRKKDL